MGKCEACGEWKYDGYYCMTDGCWLKKYTDKIWQLEDELAEVKSGVHTTIIDELREENDMLETCLRDLIRKDREQS